MKTTKSLSRVALATSLAFALALTFGCAGSKPPPADDGYSNISNIEDDLKLKCNKDYSDHYCGVGDGISTKSGSAGEIAQGKATADLILQMKQDVSKRIEGAGSVDANDADVSSAINQWVQSSALTVTNVVVRESITQFNKEEGKYKVFRLVSVPRKDALNDLKKNVSANQALNSTKAATAILTEVDNYFNKN